MEFEKWLMELTKQIQQNPQTQFEQSVESFEKTLNTKFKEHSSMLVKKQKLALKAADMKLKAFDGKDLSDDEQVEQMKAQFEKKKAQDSYDNSMLMIGESDNISQFDTYNIQGMLYNWHRWTAMYMSSWVFARAIDKPAADMIRNGWKIKIDFKERFTLRKEKIDGKYIIKKVDKSKDVYSTFYKKQNGFIQDLIQANKLARLYGGSVAGLIDDKTKESDYETELTEISPDAKLRLVVADRWQNVIPSATMVTDSGSPDWNTPMFYTVRTDSGQTFRFHHTRVLRFTNGTAPDLVQRMLMGWGIPLGVRIYNEINRDERIKNMITSLLSKQSLEIVQTAGMRAYSNGTLTPEQERRLDAKLELINRYRHFNSILFLDKDDSYSRHEGSAVGSMAQLMDSNARFVAGAIPMPQVLLYGDQQKGLSGNAVDDMRLYEDDLMTQRNEKMLNQIIKLSKWILMWMDVDYDDISITFNSSITPTKDETINMSKSLIEVYRQLKDLNIYDTIMIAQELKDAQEELIFGSALTDEKMDEIIEANTKKPKKGGKGGGGPAGGDIPDDGPLDIDGSITEGDFDSGRTDPEGAPSVTIDEMDITEEPIETTDLDQGNIPAPDTGGDLGGIE